MLCNERSINLFMFALVVRDADSFHVIFYVIFIACQSINKHSFNQSVKSNQLNNLRCHLTGKSLSFYT